MMQEYKLLKLYLNGVEVADAGATDLKYQGAGTLHHPDLSIQDDESTYLAIALFRRRMRPDAERLAEGRECDADDTLTKMWLRAGTDAPGRWTCRECGLRRTDAGDEGVHRLAFGGSCGPLLPDPLDPALAKVRDECLAESALLARECDDLTLDNYPACLNAWDHDAADGEAHPLAPTPEPRVASVGAPHEVEFSIQCHLPPVPPEAKTLSKVTEGTFQVTLSKATADALYPGLPGARWVLRTQAEADKYFGAGSQLARFFWGRKKDDPEFAMEVACPQAAARQHDDRVDATAMATAVLRGVGGGGRDGVVRTVSGAVVGRVRDPAPRLSRVQPAGWQAGEKIASEQLNAVDPVTYSPRQLSPYNALDLSCAKGEELDELAAAFGLTRLTYARRETDLANLEPDADLRRRMLLHLTTAREELDRTLTPKLPAPPRLELPNLLDPGLRMMPLGWVDVQDEE